MTDRGSATVRGSLLERNADVVSRYYSYVDEAIGPLLSDAASAAADAARLTYETRRAAADLARNAAVTAQDGTSVVQGKRVDLGGPRISQRGASRRR